MTQVCFSMGSALVFVKWLSRQICKCIMSGKSTLSSFIKAVWHFTGPMTVLSQHVYELFSALMST